MKVIVVIDSFKGSLTSLQAGNACKEGILNANNNIEVVVRPLADGGEGSVNALVDGMNGKYHSINVKGPLMEDIDVIYGIVDNTAILDIASVCGLTLVKEKNPMNTTTYGVGQVILDAIKKGCSNFIIGIGGSSTNDGGFGMLSALGYRFLDKYNNEIPYGAKGLKDLDHIDISNVNKELVNCTFNIACDVNNPLCGINGASYIYGPQKGANKDMIVLLDSYLLKYSEIVFKTLNVDYKDYPGSGAAGGLGYGFKSFLNASLTSGVDLIIKETFLEDYIKDCDIVITGEGRLDYQSIMGKAPIGVARLAKKYNKKVIAFAGSVNDDTKVLNDNGIDAYFCILNSVLTLQEAMTFEVAYKNLRDSVEQVFRVLSN